MLSFGLAGNPNSGKTTLFNELTGSTAHVGNWPGVTVDRKEGRYKKNGKDINIMDLPGIYSLSPYTPEEVIARNYLINDTPDLIINIVDATNLERNLYLTTQLIEIDCPVVIALNMMDTVEKEGDKIDSKGLEKILGVPVVEISAKQGKGIEKLVEIAEKETKKERKGKSVLLDSHIAGGISDIGNILSSNNVKHSVFNSIKLLEENEMVSSNVTLSEQKKQISEIKEELIKNDEYGDMEATVADLRYKYISKNCSPLIKKKRGKGELSKSDKMDKILTSRVWGIPIFLVAMFLVFHFTFSENLFLLGINSPGVFLQGLTGTLIEALGGGAEGLLETLGASEWVFGLIINGIIAGVGAVLSFVPQILLLFFFLSLLEDSGYMARAAFIMDRVLRKFGLSGKAFMPLIMGFGCSVPAIMATRTLESEKDRRITMMVAPYMSCGAKMPIYVIFAAALFENNSDIVIFCIYMLGIAVAIISSIIMKKTVLKDETGVFIMELPAYRFPKGKGLLFLLWDKFKGYVVRAGTIILASTIIIWFLANFSFGLQMVDENSAQSMLGIIGNAIVPIFRPLGFANGPDAWKACVAIITGLIAKEMVVSTLGVLYNPDVEGDALEDTSAEDALLTSIAATFSPLAAISFMAFNLLSVPCMAAVAALKAEMNSTKWTIFAICFWIIVAWIVSFLIFNIGSLFGF